MYTPLYEEPLLPALAGQRDDFESYVDQIIHSNVAYLDARLHAASLRMKWNSTIAFDFIWALPQVTGAFPVPIDVEIALLTDWTGTPLNQMWQTLGPKGKRIPQSRRKQTLFLGA